MHSFLTDYRSIASATEKAIHELAGYPAWAVECWETDLRMLFARRDEYEPSTETEQRQLAAADAQFDAMAPHLLTHFGFTRTEPLRS